MNMNPFSACDSSSLPTNRTQLKRVPSLTDLEKINLFVLTRNTDEISGQPQSWNKVEFKSLKPTTTTDDYKHFVVCHLKEFDEAPNISNGQSENQLPAKQVHLGISCENKSNIHVKVVYYLGGMRRSQTVAPGTTKIMDKIFNEGTSFQNLILENPKATLTSNENNESSEIKNIGVIKASVYRVTDTGKQEQKRKAELTEIKLKNSQEYLVTKAKKKKISEQGLVAVGFSAPKFTLEKEDDNQTVSYPIFETHEKIMEYEFRCRNKTGYLLELVKAGLEVEEANAQQYIEVVDDSETTDNTGTEEPKLPEYKSLTLSDKVKETTQQFEKKTVEEVIKFIKLIDEELHSAVQKVFQKERIDGFAFLSLTSPEMRGLGLVIGHQIKIKQILQCIRENSDLGETPTQQSINH